MRLPIASSRKPCFVFSFYALRGMDTYDKFPAIFRRGDNILTSVCFPAHPVPFKGSPLKGKVLVPLRTELESCDKDVLFCIFSSPEPKDELL